MLMEKSRTQQRMDPQPFTAGSLGPDLFAYSVFTRQIEQTLDGQHLSYTHRLRLIKRAATLGIGRFDANLIIATVQHRAKPKPANTKAPFATKPPRTFPYFSLAFFAIVQTAIIVAAWWIVS
jgi:hypothetical protein